MPRFEGRAANALRPVELYPGEHHWAEGSCEIRIGNTHVLCLATVEEFVPPFRRDSGLGWVTAEYEMLPRSTSERRRRPSRSNQPDARSLEISRLIGRSLRTVVDFEKLGQRTITLDCEVLQADGGTRTASVTGAYVALIDALEFLRGRDVFAKLPVTDSVAAISVGVLGHDRLLDLDYEEDSKAAIDLNVVMTGHGRLIELQGTGEERPFSRELLNELLDLAEGGIAELTRLQQAAIETLGQD